MDTTSHQDIELRSIHICNQRSADLHNEEDSDNESITSLPDYDYVPIDISQDRNYQQPNYKPLVLQPWFLITFNVWLVLCLSSVITISVMGYIQPSWWHLDTISSHRAWTYTPGFIAATTSIVYNAILNQYFNIVPFLQMANLGLDQSRGINMLSSAEVALIEPGGNMFTLFHFLNKGYFLAALMIWNFYGSAILTVLKSGFIQPVKDDKGWQLGVSYIIGFVAMILYLLLLISTISIYLCFRNHITGLRWSPNSIAARISLVQGSNILTAFRKTAIVKSRKHMTQIANSWVNKYGALRLGYWRNTQSGLIFHGLRFWKPTVTGNQQLFPGKPSQHEYVNIDTQYEPSGVQLVNSNRRSYQMLNDTSETNLRLQNRSRVLNNLQSPSNPRSPYQTSGTRNHRIHSRNNSQASGTSNMGTEYEDDPPVSIRKLRRDQRRQTMKETWLNPEDALEQLDDAASVQRISNIFLSDFWIIFTFLFGVVVILTTLVFWAQGRVSGVHSSVIMDKLHEIPHLFMFLPAALLSFFNIVFVASDLYHRAMLPIQNMSKLPNGALAKPSVLLDYISANPISAFMDALAAKDFKIAWGILLSNACGYSYVVFGRVFEFGGESSSGNIQFTVQIPALIGSLIILVIYCISIWIARPKGAVRSCWPIYNLLWTVNLCYQSPILRCPEFWAQGPKDDYDHLYSQVILADRSYAFGLLKGLDEEPHLGIGSASLRSWDVQPQHIHERLDETTKVARGVMKAGCYDEATFNGAEQFLGVAQSTWDWEMFIWEAPHFTWKAWFSKHCSKMLGQRRRRRSVQTDVPTSNMASVITMSNDQPTSIRRHNSDHGRSTGAYQPVDPSVRQAFPRRPVPLTQGPSAAG